MPKETLHITRMEGESSRIAKEDAPEFIFQKLENLRMAVKVGSLISRDPYTEKITSGLTTFQTMRELTDKNGDTNLIVLDSNAVEASLNTAGSYGALASISNDERTAASTIYGSEANLITFNNELRSGAGLNASANRPFWIGYISRTRYSNSATPVTITAGLYLDEMSYDNKFQTLDATLVDTFTMTQSQVTDTGLDAGRYSMIIVPVLDEYQKCVPYLGNIRNAWVTTAMDRGGLKIGIVMTSTNAAEYQRITAFDIFIFNPTQEQQDLELTPAYFLERVNLDEDGKYFLRKEGTLETASPPTYVEFTDDFADWETCDFEDCYVNFTASAEYNIPLGARSENATKVRYALSGLAAGDSGDSVTCKFFSRWHKGGSSQYLYYLFYDDYYRKIGSEMYTYLNIPIGDEGISDFRFKYYAWNGDRGLISGMPGTERNFSYFSPVHAPDVFPSKNIVRHKSTVVGNINIGQDFLIFTDKGTERLRIIDNANATQDEEYFEAILASHRSIAKVDDTTIAFMSYQGPVLINNRQIDTIFGRHLRKWWLDTFTKAQMEACVAGYNFKEEEIWFSFPTYATSPYTTGIIFVFDLKAYREGYGSAWWRVKTDIAVVAFETNNQFNLLGGTTTGTDKIVDFNTAGTDETVQWKLKMKVVENPLMSKKVRYDRLYVDVTSDDTIVGDCYFDGSGTSGLSLTFDADETSFIRYISKTMEAEVYNTAASANSAEVKRILLTFRSLRK